MSRHKSLEIAFVIVGLLALSTALVSAFAEEGIGFRDPSTGITYDPAQGYPEISTIHDDLTYALALAAGYSVADSRRLQIANQLVDSEMLPGSVISYTNCGGTFAPSPNPTDLFPGCKLNGTCDKLIWPQWSNMQNSATCTTSRFGPFSPFFHFPHRTGPMANRDIGALRSWGWGYTKTLVAYEAYAWGRNSDVTVMQAQYRYTRTMPITTSIPAGSLEAFAVYLHALADSYSHEECLAELDAAGVEWGTHTQDNTYPACKYNPNNMQADDVHGIEFGVTTDSQRTIDAARNVYTELAARSISIDGKYMPLPLTTTLTVSGTVTTLDGAIQHFVQDWGYDGQGPSNRRAYVDQLTTAIMAQPRTTIQRAYLPFIKK